MAKLEDLKPGAKVQALSQIVRVKLYLWNGLENRRLILFIADLKVE